MITLKGLHIGWVPGWVPSAERPWPIVVQDPYLADVQAASNSDNYFRQEELVDGEWFMKAVLTYPSHYIPKARFEGPYEGTRTVRPAGNGAEKRRNPFEWEYEGTGGLEAFKRWWASSPRNPVRTRTAHEPAEGSVGRPGLRGRPCRRL